MCAIFAWQRGTKHVALSLDWEQVVRGLGLRVQDLGFRIQDLGFGVEDLGLRVEGSWSKV